MITNYIVLHIIDIIALFFLACLLHNNNALRVNRKNYFLLGILITIVVILADIGTTFVYDGSADLRNLNILFNVFGFVLTPIIPIILIAIFDRNIIKKYFLLIIPTLLNTVAVILSPIYGLIFYVDLYNNYSRGSVFLLFIVVYIFNIMLLLSCVLSASKKFLYPIKWKIYCLSLFTLVGTSIQLLFPTVHSSWHCVTISLFLLYILLSEFDGSFDRLTQLYNRASFEKKSQQLNDKKALSVVVIDIDNFKEINDKYGHDYGDIVLKEVAAIIKNSFNEKCTCYRMGGDEFYVICKDIKEEELIKMLKNMGEKLRKERLSDNCLPTVSYGYSIFESGTTFNFTKILKEADDKMYYYKQLKK